MFGLQNTDIKNLKPTAKKRNTIHHYSLRSLEHRNRTLDPEVEQDLDNEIKSVINA